VTTYLTGVFGADMCCASSSLDRRILGRDGPRNVTSSDVARGYREAHHCHYGDAWCHEGGEDIWPDRHITQKFAKTESGRVTHLEEVPEATDLELGFQ
jgi:ribosomal protein RSM22 (predicted rRNA methylase)